MLFIYKTLIGQLYHMAVKHGIITGRYFIYKHFSKENTEIFGPVQGKGEWRRRYNSLSILIWFMISDELMSIRLEYNK